MAVQRAAKKTSQKVKLTDTASSTFAVFAICSSENGYRLSWLLNSSLGLDMQSLSHNSPELPEELSKLDIYAENDPEGAILIPNKFESNKLLSAAHKQFDYIFVVRHPLNQDQYKSLESKIKKTEGIITLVQIPNPDKKVADILNLF